MYAIQVSCPPNTANRLEWFPLCRALHPLFCAIAQSVLLRYTMLSDRFQNPGGPLLSFIFLLITHVMLSLDIDENKSVLSLSHRPVHLIVTVQALLAWQYWTVERR